MKLLITLLLLTISTPVYAGDDTKLPDVASYITVITNVTFDTIKSIRSDNRKDAFTMQGLRLGATIASSEVIKLIVHKMRPDGSDNKSFWSEHSAIAATSQGWNFYVGGSLTFATMAGRVEAKRHFPLDVTVGAGVGTLFERLFHSKSPH